MKERFVSSILVGALWLLTLPVGFAFEDDTDLASDIAGLESDSSMGYVLMNFGSGFALAIGPISSGTFDTVTSTEFYTNDGWFDTNYSEPVSWQNWSDAYTRWVLGLHPCQTFVACVERGSSIVE